MPRQKKKHQRHENDYYMTPPGLAAAAVLEALQDYKEVNEYTGKGSFLEPGCGELAPFADVAADYFDDVTAVDIMEKPDDFPYDDDVIDQRFGCDFLGPWEDPDKKYDVIVGNPPFKLAEAFLRKGLVLLKPNGVLVFLLRLCFLSSIKRIPLFKAHPPSRLVVLTKRPSFTQDGNTDGQDYAFFVWRIGFELPAPMKLCRVGWFNNADRYYNLSSLMNRKDT